MARILNLGGNRPDLAPSLPQHELEDRDVSDVPFIEVGATPAKGASRTVSDRSVIPAIIPMSRSAVAPEPPRAPESISYFRVTFQPLPFPTSAGGSLEHRLSKELAAFHHPEHAVSDQYRTLAGELERQHTTQAHRALLFSACQGSVGTTTVLLNLAITLAQSRNERTLVVDANFSKPAVAGRLGVPGAPGLREVLARTVPLSWGVHDTGLPHLNVLPNGQRAGEPDFSIWPVLLDQLRQRFDWILIDAAPWESRPELPVLVGTCPATYLVFGQSDLDQPSWNDVMHEIPRHGGTLRGYMLTQP